MTEDRIEELLYRILQNRSVRELAQEMGYKSASDLVRALKNETIGADEIKVLIDAANISLQPDLIDWIFFGLKR